MIRHVPVLTAEVLQHMKPDSGQFDGAAAVRSWAKLRLSDIEQTANFLEQLERGGEPSIAKLSLANSQVQKMAGH